LGAALEDAVGEDAEGVLNAEELAKLVQQRQSKTSIPRSLIFTLGNADCERGTRFSRMSMMRAMRQQSGIAGNLAARKISADGLLTIEREGDLWYKALYQPMDAPKREPRDRGRLVCAGHSN